MAPLFLYLWKSKHMTMKTILSFLFLGFIIVFISCQPKQPATPAVNAAPEAPAADSMNKKIITARVYVKPDKINDFIMAAKFIIDSSRAEAGCESYTLYQDPYEKTNFVFVEVWKDQMAIDNHFSMSYFKNFKPKTQDWLLKPSELKIYDVSPNE
jgi:quinol monooxygenase YgiN